MKTTSIILTSIVTCAFGLVGALQSNAQSQGAGRYVQVEYPPSTAANELQVGVTYVLWIPGGDPSLRCVIVHQHGAGAQASKGGETAAYDLHWQALAKKWDCALIGPYYHVVGVKSGQQEVISAVHTAASSSLQLLLRGGLSDADHVLYRAGRLPPDCSLYGADLDRNYSASGAPILHFNGDFLNRAGPHGCDPSEFI